MMPRFRPGNRKYNEALDRPGTEITEAKHATPAPVAIAWLTVQGDDIVPIITVTIRGLRRT